MASKAYVSKYSGQAIFPPKNSVPTGVSIQITLCGIEKLMLRVQLKSNAYTFELQLPISAGRP